MQWEHSVEDNTETLYMDGPLHDAVVLLGVDGRSPENAGLCLGMGPKDHPAQEQDVGWCLSFCRGISNNSGFMFAYSQIIP